MNNRIHDWTRQSTEATPRDAQPQPIGEILAELLNQYQLRFPNAKIEIVETSAAAI
jgi:hypothetical protein